MKRLIALASLIATPALAHPGHPVAFGAYGHLVAHILIGATLVAALWAGASILRKPLQRALSHARR